MNEADVNYVSYHYFLKIKKTNKQRANDRSPKLRTEHRLGFLVARRKVNLNGYSQNRNSFVQFAQREKAVALTVQAWAVSEGSVSVTVRDENGNRSNYYGPGSNYYCSRSANFSAGAVFCSNIFLMSVFGI